MLRNFVLALALVISGTVFAQNQKELSDLMRERNEYYFTLAVQQPSEIQTINQICSVDGFNGTQVVCYANQKQYDKLLEAGYKPTLQTPPSMLEEAKMWDGNRATYEWDSYPTYSQYESMMQAYPASTVSGRFCTYIELGTLSSGRKVMGVRINNGVTAGKPKFLYSSTIHGDETTGWIMLLRLIDELCTSTDSRIVNLVNNLDIFIFPDTNPDGTYYGGNNTVSGARRYNANGVDMNRNYPDPHGSEHPDGNAYQTETQWFMTLAETYPFTMAANYHGGAEIVNYPWDNTSTRHADDAWWQYVSQEYANLCHAVSSSYLTTANSQGDTPSGITNGADWYTIGGGRQDYMNGYRQCREVTVECSNTKNPSASQLPNFWNYNHNAMLALLEQCLNGIHGVVKDAVTLEPIDDVTITVLNHDDDYSIVSTHEGGVFHRPIKGGTWTIKATKEGYYANTADVTIADDNSKTVTIYLMPLPNDDFDYYSEISVSAGGSYVLGSLNGTTLAVPTHSDGQTVETTTVAVTAMATGFKVPKNTTIPKVTLTAAGSGQYYNISYNGRYLAKSGNNIIWNASLGSASFRWYIKNDGIYNVSGSTKYYLNYDIEHNSFVISTSNDNNVKVYSDSEIVGPNIIEATKDIAPYSGNGGYYLIASPIGSVAPTHVNGLTANGFDLYRFNQSAEKEWENYKDNSSSNYHFELEPGKGYLYANNTTTQLVFVGEQYSGDGVVSLAKDANAKLPGWNLIGNPFNATATIDRASHYVMNEYGSELIATASTTVAAMEGIFVMADMNNPSAESVTFSTNAKRDAEDANWLSLNLSRNGGKAIDRVIVRFDGRELLQKYTINDNGAIICVPQHDSDYAVVDGLETSVIPVSFKAENIGYYTLSVNNESKTVTYFHLIDKLTGDDVDMLLDDSYTFMGAPSDRNDRFVLRLRHNDFDIEGDIFAYQSGSDIVVTGEGELQIFDVMGRMVMNTRINGVETVNVPANAVYIFKLNEKVQKIVVR